MLCELHVRQHVSAALYYNTYNPQHFFKRILLSIDKTQYHYGPVWDRVIHDSHNALTLWVDVGGGAQDDAIALPLAARPRLLSSEPFGLFHPTPDISCHHGEGLKPQTGQGGADSSALTRKMFALQAPQRLSQYQQHHCSDSSTTSTSEAT